MSARGQKHELPRRSIGVRFALNKQTLTERVQCDASCHSTKSLRDSLLPDGLRIIPRVGMVGSGGSALS